MSRAFTCLENCSFLEKAAAAVVTHTNITNVDLSHNSMTSNDASHIAHIIRSAPHVARLNISCNDFSSPAGCQCIATALQEGSVSTVTRLSVLLALTSLQNLQHLDMRASHVTDSGARHLFDALAHNSSLLSLNLSNCSISDASVDSICRVVKCNCTLKSLHLKGCDISQPALLLVLKTARESGRFDGMCADALDAPGAQNNMLQEVGCSVC
jgi:Ran GTPase-activating protein (RanGAP) involved in mRNA processing and transport